jgi:hypothetical protein
MEKSPEREGSLGRGRSLVHKRVWVGKGKSQGHERAWSDKENHGDREKQGERMEALTFAAA